MQTGTVPSGTVETVPDFRISLDSSSWPPAKGELPAGTGSMVDFQIQRDLTGGGLPGVARGGSGFSVASGSVTLPMNRAELTPWAAASKRVSPGGLAWLRAHPDTLTSITLGRFIVDECSSGSFGGLALDLVESQRQMDGLFTFPWQYDSAEQRADAATVLAAIAESAGYSTTWCPVPAPWVTRFAPLLARMDGTLRPMMDRQVLSSSSNVKWVSAGGQAMLGPGSQATYWWGNSGTSLGALYDGWFNFGSTAEQIVATVAGAGFELRASSVEAMTTPTIWNISTTSVAYTKDGETTTVPLGSYAGGSRPLRVTVGSRWYEGASRMAVWVEDLSTGQRWFTDRTNKSGPDYKYVRVSVPAGGGMRDLVIQDIYDNTYTRPTAYIEHTGSPLAGVFDVSGKSAREVFQDIAKSTMGAGWQSETGDLIYRNAASLRTGKPVEAVAVRDKVEDLRWSISRDNSADRVTVSYTPAEVQTDSAHKITLWEATEPIMVLGNRTVTVTAEITGSTDRISPFSIVTANAADAANATYSRWLASSSRDGGGTRPADDAIRIVTKITGPSTVRLTITNTTNGTLWLVDGNGNPLVILRTSLQVQPGEPQVVEWGLPEDKALSPSPFDCDQWVQDATTAQAMLAWLVDQLRSPLPTITQVRIIPDLRRQLGDIVTLTDEDSGLKAKALIIGVSLEGDAGGYTQRLTLAILSVTYSDVKRWATAQGITTYGQLKAHLVANGATTYAKAREYLARVGVDA